MGLSRNVVLALAVMMLVGCAGQKPATQAETAVESPQEELDGYMRDLYKPKGDACKKAIHDVNINMDNLKKCIVTTARTLSANQKDAAKVADGVVLECDRYVQNVSGMVRTCLTREGQANRMQAATARYARDMAASMAKAALGQ